LRAYSLVKDNGCFGLLATNTIAQGDSRIASLDYLLKRGTTIFNARKTFAWPGDASLSVSRVHVAKGFARFASVLDGTPVRAISSMLESGSNLADPFRLAANSDRVFRGSMIAGEGFVISPEMASDLIRREERSKDVVFGYLIGAELNSNPDQSHSR